MANTLEIRSFLWNIARVTTEKKDARCVVCNLVMVASDSFYLKCSGCSHEYASSPVVGEVTNSSQEGDKRNSHLTSRQVAIVNKFKPISVVDFGCGTGGFLYRLGRTERQISIQGVETDLKSLRVAKDLGIQVHTSLDECKDAKLITFWHSLEHLDAEVLRGTLKRLQEKSVDTIIVSVPNASSTQHLLMKDKFCFFDNQHHWSQFSPKSLNQLFSEHGFELKQNFIILDYAVFSIIQTTMNRYLPKNQLYELVKRSNGKLELRALFSGMLALIKGTPHLVVFTIAEFLPGRRSVINAVFQRRPN
jgi:SAM-dependent methyltransferase